MKTEIKYYVAYQGTITAGINFDDNNFIINENGEKEIIPTAISGSDYFFPFCYLLL